MARTLQQIQALIPTQDDYLRSLGLESFTEDGANFSWRDRDGAVVNAEQMLEGYDPVSVLRAQGIADANDPRFSQDTINWFNQNLNTNFTGPDQYLDYVYGPGGWSRVGDYLDVGNRSADSYTNNPLNYAPDPSTMNKLAKMGIIGLAGAGLFGLLPGTESIFGGAAGAGAGAAEAAPVFTGGASGGGIAGAASGGGALSGLGATEALGLSGGLGGAGLGELGSGFWNFDPNPSFLSDTGGALGSGFAGTPGASAFFPTAGSMGIGGFTDLGLASAAADAPWGVNQLSSITDVLKKLVPSTSSGDTDWSKIINALGPSVLGYLGADNAADGYADISNRMLNEGQWARDALKATFQPGYSIADTPDFQNALDVAAQAAARATSAKVGNPVGNPGAYSEMQKWITDSVALPQLNTTRSQLINAGGIGFDQSGRAAAAGVESQGGIYDAIGGGLAALTKPKNPYEDAMKGLLGGFKLNQGYSF